MDFKKVRRFNFLNFFCSVKILSEAEPLVILANNSGTGTELSSTILLIALSSKYCVRIIIVIFFIFNDSNDKPKF